MAYSIKTISKAEQDIAAAIEWYLKINKELATRFAEELDKSFVKLTEFPEAYPIIYMDLRMFVLKTFPYKILYLVEEEMIIIHAVVHHKKHPKAWQETK